MPRDGNIDGRLLVDGAFTFSSHAGHVASRGVFKINKNVLIFKSPLLATKSYLFLK